MKTLPTLSVLFLAVLVLVGCGEKEVDVSTNAAWTDKPTKEQAEASAKFYGKLDKDTPGKVYSGIEVVGERTKEEIAHERACKKRAMNIISNEFKTYKIEIPDMDCAVYEAKVKRIRAAAKARNEAQAAKNKTNGTQGF